MEKKEEVMAKKSDDELLEATYDATDGFMVENFQDLIDLVSKEALRLWHGRTGITRFGPTREHLTEAIHHLLDTDRIKLKKYYLFE